MPIWLSTAMIWLFSAYIAMSANVVPFPADAIQRVEPDEVLSDSAGKYREVVVIGRLHDGELAMASSTGYLPDLLWLVEQARRHINDLSDG